MLRAAETKRVRCAIGGMVTLAKELHNAELRRKALIRWISFMLLRGLTWLILFQLLGTGLNQMFLSFLPGPIIGMVLLLVFLSVRGSVGEPIDTAASGLLKYLPLILVPPAVGVMMYGAEIAEGASAILGSLVISFVLTVPLCGWLMQRLISRQQRSRP